MKKVILIGASGFLGSRVMTELQKEKFEIYAVVHKTPLSQFKNLHRVEGGISALTTKLIDEIKPDIIYHCARPVFPKFKRIGRHIAALFAYRANEQLIKNLQHSDSRPLLVFASGSLMYGNSDSPHDENAPLNPISYARQYYRGEIPVLKALKDFEYPVQILRFPWLLAAGSWFEWFYLNPIRQHGAIPIFGTGNNLMEILDVEDAAKLMLQISSSVRLPDVYNIISKKALSQHEFNELVCSVFGVKQQNFEELFPGRLEKETLEAFSSSILLTSRHLEIFENFAFTSLKETLEKIKLDNLKN